MLKKIYTILLFLFFSYGLSAAANISTIEVARGEKWWGVFIGSGEMMPFSKPFAKVDVSAWHKGGIKVPFLISSTGRYIFSKEPFSIEFTGDSFIIESDFEKVSVEKGGRTLREAYLVCCHKNFPPDGKIPSPELFVSPIYDMQSELGWGADADAVLGYAEKILASGYPAGTVVIPPGWQSSIGSYMPSQTLYRDFLELVRQLHEKGFKVMLTVTPFVSGDGHIFRTHINDNYFVKGNNDRFIMVEWEGGISACYDITNSDVYNMIRSRLNSLHDDYKVDGFLFDCRDAMPDIRESKISSVKDFMNNWSRLSEGFDFCQYTMSGGNGFAPYIHNLRIRGKLDADFLKHSSAAVVTAGMLGYPFSTVSADILSQSELSEINPVLLVRYVQLAAALPIMNIPFAPWRIDDGKVQNNFREAVNIRQRMGSYIGELVQELSRTAEPIVRHMEYVFPRNGFSDCDDQFMVGNKYLVAPLFDDNNTRTVRFPRGIWTDGSGKRYRGPVVVQVSSPDGGILVFESENKK